MTRYARTGLTGEEIDEAIFAAFETDGFLTDHQTKDWDAVIEQMIEYYHDGHDVMTGEDRPVKGISKGEMTEKIFPSLPGPEDWANEPNPLLAEAAWGGITSDLWTFARPMGRLQKLLRGGYMVCRHQTTGKGWVSYITRDRRLIMEDAKKPMDRRLRTTARQADNFTALVIERNPEDRQFYADQQNALIEDVKLESSRKITYAVAQATEASR